MTKRAPLKKHLNTLDEVDSIMTAMKNFALIEINKVKKCIPDQAEMMKTMKDIGHDFFSFYPDFFSQFQTQVPLVTILIGSERGFCGNFNEKIIHNWRTVPPENTHLIVVGKKLATKLEKYKTIIQVLEGPNAVEDIPEVIFSLVHSIEELSLSLDINLNPGYWQIYFNNMDNHVLQTLQVKPLWEFNKEQGVNYTIEPVLTIPPDEFLLKFANQYVFSRLHAIFYQSFYAEQRLRVQHLQGALDRLRNIVKSLTHKLKQLRREEITQEIQIIMLSAEIMIKEA